MSFGEADVDGVSAPLALPLRGGGAMPVTVIARTTGLR
jgi:hypothetical protein